MENGDVFKTTVEDDLKEIAKCKVDILILQREIEKDALFIKNNTEIKRLNNVITNRELSSKNQLKKFVCNGLGIDFMDEGLGEETEEFKKSWCEGVAALDLEERKIKTSAGSVIYTIMPDKWTFVDDDVIKEIETIYPHLTDKYIRVVKSLKKDPLKKDLEADEIHLKRWSKEPQAPKFNYKLNGGL